eukprot:TRINITY_DN19419_c0_g6_i1.p1 TRINITY_DN19419_c0_g6~~TRINITY_DN19419_c0_g6_i1.p1  ORF type:complete len:1724 (-),score=278.13 TRINITY_DN19419_c0_g6_i1:77-5248(-)
MPLPAPLQAVRLQKEAHRQQEQYWAFESEDEDLGEQPPGTIAQSPHSGASGAFAVHSRAASDSGSDGSEPPPPPAQPGEPFDAQSPALAGRDSHSDSEASSPPNPPHPPFEEAFEIEWTHGEGATSSQADPSIEQLGAHPIAGNGVLPEFDVPASVVPPAAVASRSRMASTSRAHESETSRLNSRAQTPRDSLPKERDSRAESEAYSKPAEHNHQENIEDVDALHEGLAPGPRENLPTVAPFDAARDWMFHFFSNGETQEPVPLPAPSAEPSRESPRQQHMEYSRSGLQQTEPSRASSHPQHVDPSRFSPRPQHIEDSGVGRTLEDGTGALAPDDRVVETSRNLGLVASPRSCDSSLRYADVASAEAPALPILHDVAATPLPSLPVVQSAPAFQSQLDAPGTKSVSGVAELSSDGSPHRRTSQVPPLAIPQASGGATSDNKQTLQWGGEEDQVRDGNVTTRSASGDEDAAISNSCISENNIVADCVIDTEKSAYVEDACEHWVASGETKRELHLESFESSIGGSRDDELRSPRARSKTSTGHNIDVLRSYSAVGPAKCPGTCAFLWFLVVVICVGIGMVVMPFEVDTDFGAFMKADVPASLGRDAFLAALKGRSEDGRRLQYSSVLYTVHDLYVAYELKDTARQNSILTFDNLLKIAGFERRLRNNSLWLDLCNKSDAEDRMLCSPGLSVVGYAMPSLDLADKSIVPGQARFDGLGDFQIPIEATVTWIEATDMKELLFPKGFELDSAMETTVIRSAFRFRFPCCLATDSVQQQRAVVNEHKGWWLDFVASLIDTFESTPETLVNEDGEIEEYPFRIYFDGHRVEGVQVMDALAKDARLAIGSALFVFLYVVFHTRSILLSVTGLIIIFLSIPCSYLVFRLISGSPELNVASFLSLFLVVGLGSDMLFVYVDFWRDSKLRRHTILNRVMWTYLYAGKASLATAFTTALSFFANMVSVLKALREFGVFMGLCVMFVWLLVSLIFFPLCVLDERLMQACSKRFGLARGSSSRPGQKRAEGLHGLRLRILTAWAEAVFRRAKLALVLCVLLFIGCVVGTAFCATGDTGVPSIFPVGHNQNRVKEVLDGFHTPGTAKVFGLLDNAPRNVVDVGRVPASSMQAVGSRDAFRPLDWCEASRLVKSLNETSCKCYKQAVQISVKKEECQVGSFVPLTQTVVGLDPMTEQAFVAASQDRYGDERAMKLAGWPRVQHRSQIVLQEWDSGDTQLRSRTVVQAGATVVENSSSCPAWDEWCFCGSYTCQLPLSWQQSATIDLQARRLLEDDIDERGGEAETAAALAPSRRMVSWRVPVNRRTRVDIVFGIRSDAGSQLLGKVDAADTWSFSSSFDLRNPWAQRDIYNLCKDLPEELRVANKECWVENLRDYAHKRGARFPVLPEKFDKVVFDYLYSGIIGYPPKPVSSYVWIREGEVKATFLCADIDVNKYTSTDEALLYKALWERHLQTFNAQASRYAAGAWQSSELWVRAEAQQNLVSSTALTLVVVVLTAFLGMLCFTRDAKLAVFVVACTLFVIAGLAFVMTGLLAWTIGPIEVIALIVFVGYAVTYSLHVAHKYSCIDAVCDVQAHGDTGKIEGGISSPRLSTSSPRLSRYSERGSSGPSSSDLVAAEATPTLSEIRRARSSFAVRSIGGAAIGSAITSVGSSVFLLFCTLTIFRKLGGVVLIVTMLSILTALIPLPALLFLCGPKEPGSCVNKLIRRSSAWKRLLRRP